MTGSRPSTKSFWTTRVPASTKWSRRRTRKPTRNTFPMFDKAGLERITFTPEMIAAFQEKAGKPVWDKWVQENEAKGLPAKETLDFVLKTIAKSPARVADLNLKCPEVGTAVHERHCRAWSQGAPTRSY